MDNNVIKNYLFEIPQKIKEKEKELLDKNMMIEQLKLKKDLILFEFNKEIFFDITLKNENQRDIKRQEMLINNQEYTETNQRISDYVNVTKILQIELNFLYNQFSAYKNIIRINEVN